MSDIKLFRPSAGQATALQGRAPDQKKAAANADRKIKVMTIKVSNGLAFPVVALPGVGHIPAKGEDEQAAAQVFYVAATRATERLVIVVGGDGAFGQRLG